MFVTGIAIYPLISIIPGLLHHYTEQLPKWLAQIVVMVVLMPLATFVTVPLVTRTFNRWLLSGTAAESNQST